MRNALTPWAPRFGGSSFRELDHAWREFDSLFDRVFGGGDSPAAEGNRGWWPSVESWVRDDALHVRVDLPGIDPKDVEVTLDGNTLTVHGERKAEEAAKGGYREVRYGRFERQFTVPRGLDPEKVTAEYRNGVLEVTAPLPARVTGRKVPVQTAPAKEDSKEAA